MFGRSVRLILRLRLQDSHRMFELASRSQGRSCHHHSPMQQAYLDEADAGCALGIGLHRLNDH